MWITASRRVRLGCRLHPGDRLGQRTGEGAVRVPAEPGHLLLYSPEKAGGGFGRQLCSERGEAGQDGTNGLWVTFCEESHELPTRQRWADAVFVGAQATSTIEGRQARVSLHHKPFRWVGSRRKRGLEGRPPAIQAKTREPTASPFDPGLVTVQGDHGRSPVEGEHPAYLLVGGGDPAGCAWCEPVHLASSRSGRGDGQRVEHAFDDHDIRIGCQPMMGWSIEDHRLVEY